MQNPTDEAIRDYLRELRDDPDSRIFAPLAEALTARGRPADAERLCTRGLGIHADFHDGWLARARAFLRLGRFEEARDDARKAAALDPRSGEAFTLLAASLYKLGAVAEGLEAVRRALRLAPEDAVARQLLVRLEAEPGQAPLATTPPPRAPVAGPSRAAAPPVSAAPAPAAPAGGTSHIRYPATPGAGSRPGAPGSGDLRGSAALEEPTPLVGAGRPFPPGAALEEPTPLVGAGRPFPPMPERQPAPVALLQPLPASAAIAVPIVGIGAGPLRSSAAAPRTGPLPPAALEEPTPLVGSSRARELAGGSGSVFPVELPGGGAPLRGRQPAPGSITSMLVLPAEGAEPPPGPAGALVRTAVAPGQPAWVERLQALVDEVPVRAEESGPDRVVGLPVRDLIVGFLAVCAVVAGTYAGIREASKPARIPPGSELIAPPKLGPLAIVPVVPLSLGAPTLVAPEPDAGVPAPEIAAPPSPEVVPAKAELVEEAAPPAPVKPRPKGKAKGGGKPKKKGRR